MLSCLALGRKVPYASIFKSAVSADFTKLLLSWVQCVERTEDVGNSYSATCKRANATKQRITESAYIAHPQFFYLWPQGDLDHELKLK